MKSYQKQGKKYHFKMITLVVFLAIVKMVRVHSPSLMVESISVSTKMVNGMVRVHSPSLMVESISGSSKMVGQMDRGHPPFLMTKNM